MTKKTNSIKRNRYCVCGNSFETHEKIKKLEKRNPKLITLWKNCRICLYTVQRLADCLKPMVEEHKNVVDQYVDLGEKIKTEGLTTAEKAKLKQDIEKFKKTVIYENLTEFDQWALINVPGSISDFKSLIVHSSLDLAHRLRGFFFHQFWVKIYL